MPENDLVWCLKWCRVFLFMLFLFFPVVKIALRGTKIVVRVLNNKARGIEKYVRAINNVVRVEKNSMRAKLAY